MAELVPLGNRVVIERMPAEEVSAGGIVFPSSSTEKSNQGKVIAVGPGRILEDGNTQSMTVQKGQKVLFGKYSGTEVKVGDREYVVMNEDDILGVIA